MAKLCRLICACALLSGTALADEPATVGETITEKQALARPLGEWIEQLRDGDAKKRAEAGTAIWFHGIFFETVDLDHLHGGLAGKHAESKRRMFREQVSKHARTILALVRDPEFEHRGSAARLLVGLGRQDAKLVGELEKLALDNSTPFFVRVHVLSALLRIQPPDKPVGPILLQVFSDFPPEIEAWIEYTAGERDSISVETVQYVLFEGKRPAFADEEVQEMAAMFSKPLPEDEFGGWRGYTDLLFFTLQYSTHTAVEVPYVVKATEEGYPTVVRRLSVALLGQLGDEALAAIPQLRKLLKDKDKRLRREAAIALVQIEKDRKAIPEVARALGVSIEKAEEEVKFLFDGVERRKQHVRNIIERRDEGEIRAYTRMLSMRSGALKRNTLRTLIEVAPVAKSALPRIRELLKDEDPETRRVARKAIAAIERAEKK